MAAEIVYGDALSTSVRANLAAEVTEVEKLLGRPPKLVVVLVGDDPASRVYVNSKTKKARECGIAAEDITLPVTANNEELQTLLKGLSSQKDIDGILLQLPLPKGFDEFSALTSISPDCDVDGLHPFNQGLLLRSVETFQPCTPKGCMLLIERAFEQLGRPASFAGLHAVVVGRSILVGKPLALLLLERNCTVSICHSKTKNLAEECQRADILVAAIGRPKFFRKEHVKPGAIVIDVGINRLPDGKLVGDVDLDDVLDTAAAITPVPRGVGPMTIAMLLSNTVESARRKISSRG